MRGVPWLDRFAASINAFYRKQQTKYLFSR